MVTRCSSHYHLLLHGSDLRSITHSLTNDRFHCLCMISAATVAPAGRLAGVRSTSSLQMAAVPVKEEWVAVLKTSEIAPGELVPVDTDGLQLLIAADLDGSIYATANICPHLGTPLDQGSINAQGAL